MHQKPPTKTRKDQLLQAVILHQYPTRDGSNISFLII